MKSLTRTHVATFVICLFLGNSALGQILYVATNGDNSDGQTWQRAYTTIQAAVNAAGNNDTILVGSAGTGHGTGVYPETVDVVTPVTIESESGYETTTVGYAGATDHIIHVPVNVDYVTIRGFSIFGATASGDWQQGGIYLEQADHCTVENNRCGWEDGTAYNQMGIFMEYAHYNTVRNNICNENVYCGIRLWGCDYNIIHDNQCSDQTNGRGIHLYVGCNYNHIVGNQCNWNDSDGIYIQNSGENTIAYNTCNSNTKYMGLKISSINYYNAVIGNVSSNNGMDGLNLVEAYYAVITDNILSGNARKAINLSTNSKYGHFYHNDITGSIASAWWAENDWSTPTEMCYLYNPTVKSMMGNYYAGMDHTDSDGDGITDADMDLPGAEHTDEYPLAAEPNQYAVQTWYVGSDDGLSMDPAGSPGWVEIAAGASCIWTSETAAAANIDFTALDNGDGWTGRIRFDTTVNGSDMTIEVGSADPNGANFTADPQAVLAGSMSMFTFETEAVSFTVPSQKALAMRVTNNGAAVVNIRKGAFTYISAPAGISQAWPGVLLGDIAGDPGVDMVDFAYLAIRWGRTDCATTDDCEGADLDGLGSVGIEDLRIMAENWLVGK